MLPPLPEDPEGDVDGEYAEWLMGNAEIHICNSRDLVDHMEIRTRYDEFLAYRAAQMLKDSEKF